MPRAASGALLGLLILGCRLTPSAPDHPTSTGSGAEEDLRSKHLENEVAYIPPMCWTRTQDAGGRLHNPCQACHTNSREPNYRNDADLQLEYSFPAPARTNPWSNLFQSQEAQPPSKSVMRRLVRTSNYTAPDGRNLLAERLRNLPTGWDFDGDGRWTGYLPDACYQFDREGFDRNPEGGFTGWRAFAYAPFPGAFWPTNGSTDDVLIRLDAPFRQNLEGTFDLDIYRVNFAIVEALIHRQDIRIRPVDERKLGFDLDKDGRLGVARKVTFRWDPRKGVHMRYAGMAGQLQGTGRVHLAAGLFPEGTEFLHSVRYLDVRRNGAVTLAPRFKELRYARKRVWHSYHDLQASAGAEAKEKFDFPDRTRTFLGNMEQGVGNGQGWVYQGFIEDRRGDLRPQTFEETVSCMGCHSGLGATTDGTFAFARKLGNHSFQGGWYHWTQKGLEGMPEPQVGSPHSGAVSEYAFYLKTSGAGDEYRQNREVMARFFSPEGELLPGALAALGKDASTLLLPSPERAWELNKAYWGIVKTQGFTRGREVFLEPASHVHRRVDEGQPTGIREAVEIPRQFLRTEPPIRTGK